MDTLTRFRQDEAVRFIKWLANNPENAYRIMSILREDYDNEMLLRRLQDMKENEFYFLVPIVTSNSWLNAKAENALCKWKAKKLERNIQFSSMESMIEEIITAMKEEMEE
ncbi:MAG TPA: hypothetical protein H9671_05365 [Firmicutes bacterium]|nr:hypothetical protein [Bacillota bacterium]